VRVSAIDEMVRPTDDAHCATPKSSSFTPFDVSMTFASLRSPWTIPAQWAVPSATAICMIKGRACAGGSAPFFKRDSSVAGQVLHHEVGGALFVAHVV
jgi:hypothetical protein